MPDRTEAPDPRRWWTLVVLSASLLVIGLDNTILNVALPTLENDLGATSSQLQWIVDSYMLVFAGLLLTAGALGDRFGRKRGLTIGLAIFGLGSGLSALATSPEMLIATRALMGIGGAFIMPSTLSIITAVFPANERAKAIGVWAGVSGLGIAIGPVAGGWLIEHASWNAVFLVNLPFVVAALTAGKWLVPESKDPAAPRLDVPGFALSIGGLTTLVWAIIEAPAKGWTSPTILAAFGVAAVVLGAFMAWELRTREPMLDIRLFRNPRFSGASAAITLVFFSMFGSIFFLTQYLQGVLEFSALEAGLRVTPVAVGLIIGGPISAKLAARIGTKLRGRRRARARRGRPHDRHPVPGRLELRHRRRAPARPRLRHGHGDGSRHRVRDGLAAAGEGERRLRRQRHHPHDRRRARRRDPRVAPRQPVPWRHGRGRQRAAARRGRERERHAQRRPGRRPPAWATAAWPTPPRRRS